jgi:K+-transporting ATPase ATPase C chain
MKNLIISLRSYLMFTVLLGLIYPIAMTGLSNIVFPFQSQGSIIKEQGKAVGSALISQKFTSDKYFWSRPSAVDHNPVPSGASSLGPTSEALKKSLADKDIKMPQDLLFASGSGLDPHISPEAAAYQVERIARARNIEPQQLEKLVAEWTQDREWGFFGENRVSVLQLNLALDKLSKE